MKLPRLGTRVRTKGGVTGTVKRITIDEDLTRLWIETDGDHWDAPEYLAFDAVGWTPLD